MNLYETIATRILNWTEMILKDLVPRTARCYCTPLLCYWTLLDVPLVIYTEVIMWSYYHQPTSLANQHVEVVLKRLPTKCGLSTTVPTAFQPMFWMFEQLSTKGWDHPVSFNPKRYKNSSQASRGHQDLLQREARLCNGTIPLQVYIRAFKPSRLHPENEQNAL